MLLQRWFFMAPLFLDSLSRGLCHDIFALDVEFCPSLVLPVLITEKAYLLNLNPWCQSQISPWTHPHVLHPPWNALHCTVLQWLMHPLPWANGVSQAARLWLHAMDWLSWHLSFSQRVNKFHHCFNFPAWNSYLIIQSFHDSSYTNNMLNFPLSQWYKQTSFFSLWLCKYLKHAYVYFTEVKYR